MKPSFPHKFNTPDGYFEDMEQKILDQTLDATTAKVVPLFQKRVFKVAMSAAAAVILLVGFWFFNSSSDVVTPEDQIDAQELVYEVYFEDDVNEEYILEEEPVLVEYVGLTNP